MFKLFLLILVFITGCSESGKNDFSFPEQGNETPDFSSDSAYSFVEKQLNFGPRVPNTVAHRSTRNYLRDKLSKYAGKNAVYVQNFKVKGYDETLDLSNIIASFNTTSRTRILLCAHWDTRPRADEDSTQTEQPIPGADDGASGVAVLLELARIMSEETPPIGVDIILFDGEDYGTSGDISNYFLGSRHWSANPPVPGYAPRFGILLDMVGAENAVFSKERYSMHYAPRIVQGLWSLAEELGYAELFPNEEGAAISDDHVIINEQTNIQVIDFINHKSNNKGAAVFAPHWHTHQDNIEIIEKETLQAVGHVLTELIYNRIEE